MRNKITLLLAMGMLTACHVQSGVQGRYGEAQAVCRTEAEMIVAQNPQIVALTPEQQKAELVTQFAACMSKNNWRIANPMKPKKGKEPDPIDAARPAAAAPPSPPVAQPPSPVTQPAAVPTPYPPAPPPEPAPGRQF